MKVTTELDGQKADIMKAARSAIRLKHSLAADAELRRVLPELEARIDLAIQMGEPLELTAADIFDEVEDAN